MMRSGFESVDVWMMNAVQYQYVSDQIDSAHKNDEVRRCLRMMLRAAETLQVEISMINFDGYHYDCLNTYGEEIIEPLVLTQREIIACCQSAVKNISDYLHVVEVPYPNAQAASDWCLVNYPAKRTKRKGEPVFDIPQFKMIAPRLFIFLNKADAMHFKLTWG